MSFTVVSGPERRHNMLRTCSKREIVTASETAVWNGLRSEDAGLTRLIREHGPMNLERAYEVMKEFDLQGDIGDTIMYRQALAKRGDLGASTQDKLLSANALGLFRL